MDSDEYEEEPQYGINYHEILPDNLRTKEIMEKRAAEEARQRDLAEDVSPAQLNLHKAQKTKSQRRQRKETKAT